VGRWREYSDAMEGGTTSQGSVVARRGGGEARLSKKREFGCGVGANARVSVCVLKEKSLEVVRVALLHEQGEGMWRRSGPTQQSREVERNRDEIIEQHVVH
jgi:hypothetical protein